MGEFVADSLFRYIHDRELRMLETDLKNIKEYGTIQKNTTESIAEQIQEQLLSEFLDDLKVDNLKSDSEQDIELSINEKEISDPDLYLAYFNPNLYRFIKISKGEPDPLIEAVKTINQVEKLYNQLNKFT